MSKFSKALELIGVSPKESRDSFDDDYFEDDFEQEEPSSALLPPRRSVLTDIQRAATAREGMYWMTIMTSRAALLRALRHRPRLPHRYRQEADFPLSAAEPLRETRAQW